MAKSKAAKRQPIAFMSYVRFDDQHENGRITQFRERLSGEVRVQTGLEFPIFQDRNDIKWGQNWKERIEQSTDSVTFLIPVITPSFFTSPSCLDELEQFLKREKKLKRNDLVLPLYYVDCPILNDNAKRKQDKLAQAIAASQYADWRELRFEPSGSPQVGKTLARLATQIRDALERVAEPKRRATKPTARKAPRRRRRVTPAKPGRTTSEAALAGALSAETASERAQTAQGPSARTEPTTVLVDAMHRGDYATIGDAIKAASPGVRILVRPGLYQEGLTVDKPLEIIGDGDPGEIVVQARGMHVLLFQTTMGRVANLTFRQMGDGKWYGIDIAQGRLELEDCDITSQSLACVGIHGGADPRLRRNRIHDGRASGVFVYKNGLGTLEENDIFANTSVGVRIMEGGNPTLRRNRIHDGKASGVFVYENGLGTLEDNDIFANTSVGVAIMEGSNPTLRRNRIHDGKAGGVLVCDNGLGTLEDNDIFANTSVGVAIMEGSNPTLRRNRIHDGKGSGVLVCENGLGTLEENDIFANTSVGVRIMEGSNPTLRRNRINKNGYQAVWIHDKGAGIIEDNDLRDNPGGAWDISEDSKPNVKRARNLTDDK